MDPKYVLEAELSLAEGRQGEHSRFPPIFQSKVGQVPFPELEDWGRSISQGMGDKVPIRVSTEKPEPPMEGPESVRRETQHLHGRCSRKKAKLEIK